MTISNAFSYLSATFPLPLHLLLSVTDAHFKHTFFNADSSLVPGKLIDVLLNLNPRYNQWPQRMDINIRPSL
jgi:hypothetical protein